MDCGIWCIISCSIIYTNVLLYMYNYNYNYYTVLRPGGGKRINVNHRDALQIVSGSRVLYAFE